MKPKQLRRNAGLVLFASGFSHVAQLWIYGIVPHILVSVGLGLCYIMIGLGLLGQSKTSLWLGSIIPPVGALGSVWRYTDYGHDPIVLAHLAVNIVVSLICIRLLFITYNWLGKLKARGT